MSALPPIPTDPNISTQLRGWMGDMLTDSIAYDALFTEHTSLLAGLRPPNILVDGWCQIGQGAVANLSLVPTYGKVDMWAAFASNAVVGAGTIDQATPAGFGRSMMVNTATLTGATGIISIRQRIEGARSCLFSQTPLSFSMVVRANTLTSFPARLILRTPTVLDTFAATTVTYTSADTTVNGTDDLSRPYQFENIPLASYANGMEVEIQFQVGTIVTKRIIVNSIQLTPGAKCPQGSVVLTTAPYAYSPPLTFEQELAVVHRYYQKSFPYATAPAQNTGVIDGLLQYQATRAGVNSTSTMLPMKAQMRTSTPTFTFYNPSAANANWRNRGIGADSGAASIGTQGQHVNYILNPQVAGDLVGNNIAIHWTADARF